MSTKRPAAKEDELWDIIGSLDKSIQEKSQPVRFLFFLLVAACFLTSCSFCVLLVPFVFFLLFTACCHLMQLACLTKSKHQKAAKNDRNSCQ
jgi:hypothetical protein